MQTLPEAPADQEVAGVRMGAPPPRAIPCRQCGGEFLLDESDGLPACGLGPECELYSFTQTALVLMSWSDARIREAYTRIGGELPRALTDPFWHPAPARDDRPILLQSASSERSKPDERPRPPTGFRIDL